MQPVSISPDSLNFIDFDAFYVLEWAAWLVREFRATLGIVHAIPAVYDAAVGWCVAPEITRQASAEAKARIDAVQVTGTKAAQVFIQAGNPPSVVADTAGSFGADLLVIGRHGGADVAGAVLQNAYAILRESPCPVVRIWNGFHRYHFVTTLVLNSFGMTTFTTVKNLHDNR